MEYLLLNKTIFSLDKRIDIVKNFENNKLVKEFYYYFKGKGRKYYEF